MTELTYRTRSEFAAAAIRVDGKPIDFKNYPMFKGIYDGPFKKMLLKTCRQIGKSTTIGAFEVSESSLVPHFKNIFIAPSKEQTHRFSTLKVGKMINYSPIIKELFVTSKTNNRVFSREFSNGAEINFSYADDDADRVRGLTGDRLCLDEVQDMILDVVVPVIKECLSESAYQYEVYCGTPKTNENGIEYYWRNSTQTEWVMKCSGCGRHSAICSEKQFGKLGPICTQCQTYLNPREGFWHDTNKEIVDIKGFHISRAIMPKNVPAAWPVGPSRDKALEKWTEVLKKLDGPTAYPISKFRNEVIGMSDTQGRRVITIEQLKSLQTGPSISMRPNLEANARGILRLGAGIDWSGGGTKITSRTVLTILGRLQGMNGRNRLMYYKIFPGNNPVDELNEIYAVLQMYNLNDALYVGCDAGEGNANTDMLRKKFNNPKKIIKFRYSGQLKTYIKWDTEGNFFSLNRTAAIDALMSNFNNGLFEFPREHDMEIPFSDILNMYEETTKQGRKYWDHAANKPDDFLHSLNFAKIALQLSIGELDLTAT